MKQLGLTLCIYLSASIGFSQTSVNIQRDLKTPLSHVFDPSKLPDIELVADDFHEHEMEMPLPGGIDESLRKKIDTERERKLKQMVNIRRVINTKSTDPIEITPSVLKNTDGLSGSGTPNDNHIAVANNGQFISVMNTYIRVHNDTGKPIKGWSLINFANSNKKIDNVNIANDPMNTRTYDPRVLYDPFADRFILFFMHGVTDKTSFIVVGFSTPGDPLKPWNIYKVTGCPIKDTVWSDYPIVCQNKDDVFFTVNLLGNGTSWEEGFREAIIWQLRKEDGYNGDTLHKNVFTGIKHNNQALRSICAIQNGPLPDGTDNYFISVRPIDKKNDTVFLHHITNTQKSGLAQFELKVLKSKNPYGFPSSALQPDTGLRYKLRTNDCRVLTGIRKGNQIQYMQNSMNFNTLQAHLMHGTIYNIDADQPNLETTLYTHDSLDFGYPAMAYANSTPDDGSVILTCVYSGPGYLKTTGKLETTGFFPGTGLLYRNRYGEYSKYLRVKYGTSLINYGGIKPDEQRWGDYEGIQSKYNEPGVFYAIGSYGKNNIMYNYVTRFKINDDRLDNPIANIRVFPVPSINDEVKIEITYPTYADIRGELYNVNAQLSGNDQNHFSVSIHVEPGTHLYGMHTHQLSPGTYQLRLFNASNEIIKSQKIIIQ